LLSANAVLIVLGLREVPSSLSSASGITGVIGAAAIQLGIGLVACVGGLSWQRHARTMGISLVLALVFAAGYLSLIALEFANVHVGIDTTATIYLLFVGVAVAAGLATRIAAFRLRDSVIAAVWALVAGTALWSLGVLIINYATWGGHNWYLFWLGDGAVADFHRSGSHDFAAFILQDLQGALFFHPLLSAVVGAVGGLLGGLLARGFLALRRETD
jgi:hypothetical protein